MKYLNTYEDYNTHDRGNEPQQFNFNLPCTIHCSKDEMPELIQYLETLYDEDFDFLNNNGLNPGFTGGRNIYIGLNGSWKGWDRDDDRDPSYGENIIEFSMIKKNQNFMMMIWRLIYEIFKEI